MTSLQNRLKNFRDELLGICPNTYHYRRPPRKESPFLIWAEDGEGEESFESNNRKAEQVIHGYLDYFTKEEFDQAVDDIQEVLNGRGSEWRLTDIQYEDETNLIHYMWEWRM